MPLWPTGARTVILSALVAWLPRGAAGQEVRVEGEGQRFAVGSIGVLPPNAGADVSNALRLEGLAGAVRLGVGLGHGRQLELRYRSLGDENVYHTADPSIVLEGVQRVRHDTVDVLLSQRLGHSPVRLELGYRHLRLERSWADTVVLGDFGHTLDYTSDYGGHGVRGAAAIDVRVVGPLHLEGALGWSYTSGHEVVHLVSTDSSDPEDRSPDVDREQTRGVSMLDLSARLRVEVGRAWLAVGYRQDHWQGSGELAEYSAGGLTVGLGVRLGGR